MTSSPLLPLTVVDHEEEKEAVVAWHRDPNHHHSSISLPLSFPHRLTVRDLQGHCLGIRSVLECDSSRVVHPRAVVLDSPLDALCTGRHYLTELKDEAANFSFCHAQTAEQDISSQSPSPQKGMEKRVEDERLEEESEREKRESSQYSYPTDSPFPSSPSLMEKEEENLVVVPPTLRSIPVALSSSCCAVPAVASPRPCTTSTKRSVKFKNRIVIKEYSVEERSGVVDREMSLVMERSSTFLSMRVEEDNEKRNEEERSRWRPNSPSSPFSPARQRETRRTVCMVGCNKDARCKFNGNKGELRHQPIGVVPRREKKNQRSLLLLGTSTNISNTHPGIAVETSERVEVVQCPTAFMAGALKRERDDGSEKDICAAAPNLRRATQEHDESQGFVPYMALVNGKVTLITLEFLEGLCNEEVRQAEKKIFEEQHKEAEALLASIKHYLD